MLVCAVVMKTSSGMFRSGDNEHVADIFSKRFQATVPGTCNVGLLEMVLHAEDSRVFASMTWHDHQCSGQS